jgi:hypothetical protein
VLLTSDKIGCHVRACYHLSTRHILSFASPISSIKTPHLIFCINSFHPHAMSINPFPELKILFETALNGFEKRTGSNLVQHQIIDKLVNCDSADSIIGVIKEQAQALHNFQGDDGKLMTSLKRTVNVLYTLSTSGVLGEGIGLVCVYSFHGSTGMRHIMHFFFSLSHRQKRSLLESLYFYLYVSYTSSFGRTLVTLIRRSKILTRATMPSLIFSSHSNPSSGVLTHIKTFHPLRR